MSRSRFESILWSLHISNPENEKKKGTPDYDCLFKIKPLYNQIITACQANFHPNKNICIDERMISSKDRIKMKKFIKGKSTTRGYKLYILADSATGYTWNILFILRRASPARVRAELLVCCEPLATVLTGWGLHFVCRPFLTSPLFQHLYTKHIGCCGIISKDLAGFPRTDKKDLTKQTERGDMRWIQKENLLFLKWMVAQEVAMCSTCTKPSLGTPCRAEWSGQVCGKAGQCLSLTPWWISARTLGEWTSRIQSWAGSLCTTKRWSGTRLFSITLLISP